MISIDRPWARGQAASHMASIWQDQKWQHPTSSCSQLRSTGCPSYSILTPWGSYSGGNSTPACSSVPHFCSSLAPDFAFLRAGPLDSACRAGAARFFAAFFAGSAVACLRHLAGASSSSSSSSSCSSSDADASSSSSSSSDEESAGREHYTQAASGMQWHVQGRGFTCASSHS